MRDAVNANTRISVRDNPDLSGDTELPSVPKEDLGPLSLDLPVPTFQRRGRDRIILMTPFPIDISGKESLRCLPSVAIRL